MFGKKSNVAVQNKLKTELLKEINQVLYKLEKGQYNKQLGEEVKGYVAQLRNGYQRLENSIGGADSDISNGCTRVRHSLKELLEASNDNLIGRFEDSVMGLLFDIDQIIDLEDGIIEEISLEEDNKTREQRNFEKKIGEISQIEQDFIKHRNRVDEEIHKLERDKTELDKKLLAEKNSRLQHNIFQQITATRNKINTLQVKSQQYVSCYNLLSTIKSYAEELVEVGNLSNVELQKAKIVLNINRLREVLDDPAKLEPLLRIIHKDLKKAQENIKLINTQTSTVFQVPLEQSEEMAAYINSLIQEQTEDELASGGMSEIESYLKNIQSNNN